MADDNPLRLPWTYEPVDVTHYRRVHHILDADRNLVAEALHLAEDNKTGPLLAAAPRLAMLLRVFVGSGELEDTPLSALAVRIDRAATEARALLAELSALGVTGDD